MNKILKRRIIIPAVVIFLGIILIIIGLAKGAITDYENTLEFNSFEANISSGNIYNLDIDISLADINVISTNDVKDFKIKAENVSKDFIEYSTSNNTLKLRYETKKWYQAIFLPAYWENKGKIELYVPASVSFKDVEIKSEYGELNISYLTADRAYVDCASGDNHIKNLTCNYTEINNNNANINGVNIDAAAADLNLKSADMAVFSNFSTESLILNNDGDLKLSGMITGDSSFYSDDGDTKITIYGDKSDYSFKVIDGDVTVNNKEAKYNEKANYLIEAKGDMSIDIK